MMTVDIEVVAPSGRRLKGAVARPGGAGLHPGVVVIHEVFGDQPEMRAVCDDFARHGYVAVMPDLFSSRGRACPIIAYFGAKDKMIGRTHAERLSRHLEILDIEHDVKVYDDAGHCFMTQGHHPIGLVPSAWRARWLTPHVGFSGSFGTSP